MVLIVQIKIKNSFFGLGLIDWISIVQNATKNFIYLEGCHWSKKALKGKLEKIVMAQNSVDQNSLKPNVI